MSDFAKVVRMIRYLALDLDVAAEQLRKVAKHLSETDQEIEEGTEMAKVLVDLVYQLDALGVINRRDNELLTVCTASLADEIAK